MTSARSLTTAERARRTPRRRRALAAVLLLVTALAPVSAAAQLPLPITLAGELLWTSGDRMVISVRGQTVTVDLSAIPLDRYLALRPGAAVLVSGVWTEGGVLVADALRALPGVPGSAEREGL